MKYLRILVAVLALCAGGMGGYWLLDCVIQAQSYTVANGAWRTNPEIGTQAANPYTRAGIAQTGLLALPRSEAVYYNAFTDDAGRPLKADAVYVIQGRNLPGRWWSITAYGADNFLIDNDAQAYSIKSTQVPRHANGSFTAYLSRRPRGANWLAAGAKQQQLSLTLRLYNPPQELDRHLGGVELPSIRRVSQARP